ncbi:MAG: mechanosensitive ion channel [Chitinophagales bacterium]|nr:mechanosensitive ion channel [Chitinophagales bacterium]
MFWLFKKFVLNRYYRRKNMDEGRVYAFNQLLKYFVYVITLMLAVQSLGFELSVIWAAGAALLVGVGLGLQQTFNDFASGIILLLEGTVQKGDWIEIGNTIGEVKKIGLRTSLITTRRNISIIVPNSKITVDNVINLSHNNKVIRHDIAVGVAYGSDTQLVKKVLLECAQRHSKVMPGAFVRFVDFGDSALNFELLFWSSEYQQIEDVRSDLRFMIDIAFRKHNISIPFPQRDLHIKGAVHAHFNDRIIEKQDKK